MLASFSSHGIRHGPLRSADTVVKDVCQKFSLNRPNTTFICTFIKHFTLTKTNHRSFFYFYFFFDLLKLHVTARLEETHKSFSVLFEGVGTEAVINPVSSE